MSGGNQKKQARSSGSRRQEGWEEAGGEFYQESYPGMGEQDIWDNLQRTDANKLATLLPSKQVRATTVKRVRSQSERRQSTAARSTVNHDVHLSMLPDLSENLSNEERIWDEIMQIKAMPVSMAQKRDLKRQLQSATKLRLQGLEQLQWKRRKAWQQTTARWREALGKLEPWRHDVKKIEGNFGTGVVAYFLFLRWLLFLNLCMSLVIVAFMILPKVLLTRPDQGECVTETDATSIECCTQQYNTSLVSNTHPLLDVMQGSGILEKTILFYGVYANEIYTLRSGNETEPVVNINYEMPLAYVTVTVFYFLLTLVAIVFSAAKGFRERLIEGEGQFYVYCNLIFGGWDFCIHNEKSAFMKHRAIYNELWMRLEEEKLQEERQSRSKEEVILLGFRRIVINIIVVLILIASGALIYTVFNYSLSELNRLSGTESRDRSNEPLTILNGENDYFPDFNESMFDDNSGLDFDSTTSIYERKDQGNQTALVAGALRNIFRDVGYLDLSSSTDLLSLLLEFLPVLCIVALNMIVPVVFEYMIVYENYTPAFVVKMTLFRTVFLRLASLGMLLSQIYLLVRDTSSDTCYIGMERNQLLCWETYVGQQLYKLLFADFLIQFIVTFLFNFPRAMLARHTENKCCKFVGEQNFTLTQHVLDVVYTQTIIWLGMFFCPFLPIIGTLSFFIRFYIKKFACLVNSTPAPTVYRASKSKSLFMFVLLTAFFISMLPVGYSIAEIVPSRSCGPFRGLTTVWSQVTKTFETFPNFLRDFVFFLGTSAFALPAAIILILLLYYYWAIAAANRHMVQVLKNQLVLEGHDKQFLLNRLSAYIRQHQKRCEKSARHQNRTSFIDDESSRQGSK